MPLENKKVSRCFHGKLLEIHRNERCEAVSSREWERIHEKSMSQTGGWYVELEEVWMWKSVKISIITYQGQCRLQACKTMSVWGHLPP